MGVRSLPEKQDKDYIKNIIHCYAMGEIERAQAARLVISTMEELGVKKIYLDDCKIQIKETKEGQYIAIEGTNSYQYCNKCGRRKSKERYLYTCYEGKVDDIITVMCVVCGSIYKKQVINN